MAENHRMIEAMTMEQRRQLQQEIPILTAEIRALYQEFDRKLHLHGAQVPLEFTFDAEQLGAYQRGSEHGKERFVFSLLFIGYHNNSQIKKADRLDLYRHEYAHYMQVHLNIPKEFLHTPGVHGSAWKYCCSLIGAAPTEYFEHGKGQRTHDYEEVLKNPWNNPHAGMLDTRRREKEYQDSRNRVVRYQAGDLVQHPKFGEGIVENVEALDASVRLHIRFGESIKKIDQKWLHRSQYHRKG